MRLSARLPADRQHRVALSQGGSYSVNTPVGKEESAHESQVCERVSHTIRSSSIVCSGTSIASPLSRCLNSDSDRSVHAIDSLRRTSSSQSPRHAEQSADGRADSDHRSPTGQSAPNATLACASKSWSECTSCTSSGRAPLHIPSINHSQRATGALQTTPYAPNRRATQLRTKANERTIGAAVGSIRFDRIPEQYLSQECHVVVAQNSRRTLYPCRDHAEGAKCRSKAFANRAKQRKPKSAGSIRFDSIGFRVGSVFTVWRLVHGWSRDLVCLNSGTHAYVCEYLAPRDILMAIEDLRHFVTRRRHTHPQTVRQTAHIAT